MKHTNLNQYIVNKVTCPSTFTQTQRISIVTNMPPIRNDYILVRGTTSRHDQYVVYVRRTIPLYYVTLFVQPGQSVIK